MDYRKEIPYDAFGDHAPIEGKSIEGDCISREAVLNFSCTVTGVTEEQAPMLKAIGRSIEAYVRQIPAADVRENVKARWIDMGDHLLCSGCGATHYGADKNFCPNCGADMREEHNT